MMIPESYLESLNEALAARAEEVCRCLLPGGRKSTNRWVCGGVDGGPGKSMDVVLTGDKAGVWHDRATGESGRLLRLWQEHAASFPEAVEKAAEFVGMGPPDVEDRVLDLRNYIYTAPAPDPAPAANPDEPPPYVPGARGIDWKSCVAALDDTEIAKLADWRGISVDFIRWLKSQDLIGLFRGRYAFPVHDSAGAVCRIHYRLDKGWAYEPKGGGESSALVIGNPRHATMTLACESQWDAFALLDRLHAHDPENAGIFAAIITRGATSNTDFSKLAIQRLIACPQNDPPEKASKTTGRTPAEEWLFKIQSTRRHEVEFTVFHTPAEHKDANDWILAEKPNHHAVFDAVVEGAKDPALAGVRTSREILATPTKDDPNALIGPERRFLSRGGSWLIVGQSGIGKSTLTTGLAMHAAAGVPWHGIKFRHPLRTLIVQAENDEGDLAEMLRGALRASGMSDDSEQTALDNLIWRRECVKTGADFCKALRATVMATAADLVMVDPLLSFIGDDISQQKVASTFLRNQLQPVLAETGAIAVLIHHTGKPAKDSKPGGTVHDAAYAGLGSSELTNWARAVSNFSGGGEDGIYRFLNAKRGSRAGMINQFTGEPSNEIFLRHAPVGLGWVQCEPAAKPKPGNGPKIIVEDVADHLGEKPMRRDKLTAQLCARFGIQERTAREKIAHALALDLIHVAKTEPRDGGGKPIEVLAAGPAPAIGGEQSADATLQSPAA